MGNVRYNPSMTTIVEAIYSHGVLEPLQALDLLEKQRVRLTIETLVEKSETERAAARRALVERLRKSTFSYGGPMPTRDELHER